MADLLYDIAMAVYDELGQSKGGTATGGSTTTVVDSGLLGSDDDWNGGMVVVVHSTDSAAPESEFGKVTDYVTSGGTITLAPALSIACALGDLYAVASGKHYPYEDMLRIINRTLRWLGPFPAVDTSLTTTTATEYTIPIAAKEKLVQVWRSTFGTSSDQRWEELYDWYIVPHGTPGSEGTLIFRSAPLSGQTLRLIYLTKHSKLWLDSDKVLEYVDMERIIPEVVVNLFKWKLGSMSGKDSLFVERVNLAIAERDEARRKYPIRMPQPPHKSLYSTDPGDRSTTYGPWLVS